MWYPEDMVIITWNTYKWSKAFDKKSRRQPIRPRRWTHIPLCGECFLNQTHIHWHSEILDTLTIFLVDLTFLMLRNWLTCQFHVISFCPSTETLPTSKSLNARLKLRISDVGLIRVSDWSKFKALSIFGVETLHTGYQVDRACILPWWGEG